MLEANDLVSLVKQVRDHYVSLYGKDLHGHCEEAVSDLADLLMKHGYQGETVNGTYAQPHHWPEGDTSPVSGHGWVEVNGKILDPTREQFGSAMLVIPVHGRDAKLYKAEYRNRLDEMIHRDRGLRMTPTMPTLIEAVTMQGSRFYWKKGGPITLQGYHHSNSRIRTFSLKKSPGGIYFHAVRGSQIGGESDIKASITLNSPLITNDRRAVQHSDAQRREAMMVRGYDGMIWMDDDDQPLEIVAFEPHQIMMNN